MADNASAPLPSLDDLRTVNHAAAVMLDDLQLSEMTKQTYGHGLDALIRFLHYREGDDARADDLAPYPLERLDEEVLYHFSRWLRDAYPDPRTDEDKGTRTTQTYLVAARRLMNWLDLHDLLPQEISYDRMVRRVDQGRGSRRSGYQQRRVDPNVTRVISYYLEQPLPQKGVGRLTLLRNRALMAVLYDTAARISEALALTREDVLDGRAHKVRLTKTKNGKPRTVFLSEESQKLIKAYVAERDDSIYAPLFVSHGRNKGTPLTPAYAWELVKKAARAEGLYDNTSPHSLRHRRAQDLLDEGMPLEWVAALLGHEHPDTTRIVYAWETDENRLADMVATYGFAPSQATRDGRRDEDGFPG